MSARLTKGIRVFKNLILRLQNDKNLKSLLKDSGLLYVAGIFSIGLTFIQQITTANWLGIDVFGQFATIVGMTTLLMLIFDFRTWEASAKLLSRAFANQDYTDASSIITWLILLDILAGLLGASVLMLAGTWAADQLLDAPQLGYLISWYAITIPLHLFSIGVPSTFIRLQGRFDLLAGKSVIYALIRLILISGVAWLGWGLEAVILAAILSEIIQALMLFLMMLWITGRDERWVRLFNLTLPKNINNHIKLIGELWVGATIKGFQTESFIPILALLTGSTEVGLYRVAYDIANLLTRLISPFSIVIQPTLFQIFEEQTVTDFVRYIKQSSVILAVFVVPFVLGIISLGPFILPRLVGEGYEGVSLITTILAIGISFPSITIWLRPAIVAQNAVQQQNIASIAGLIIILIALVFFAPYGAIGAALVMAGFLILYTIVSLFIFYRNLQKMDYVRTY